MECNQSRRAGPRSIDNFTRRDRIANFLVEVRVPPEKIDKQGCIRTAIRHLSAPKRLPATPAPASQPIVLGAEVQEALRNETMGHEEIDQRVVYEERRHRPIERQEIAGAHKHISMFIEQGLITREESDAITQLHEIDQKVVSGKVDERESEHLSVNVLKPEARARLEKRLRGAVDHATRLRQVFEALQRIEPRYDDALRFLIGHKDVLSNQSQDALQQAVATLLADVDLFASVVDLMDHKDQEVRMLSVCLPPYSYIVKRNQQIDNFLITEDFVDDLRHLEGNALSDCLNSPDQEARTRPAIAMRCLIALIEHLVKPTRLRKEVRRLKIHQILEEFYRTTDDVEEARQQAQNFLGFRLRRLFPDLSADERATFTEHSSELIESIEQKVLDERRAARQAEIESREQRTNSRVETETDLDSIDDDLDLSDGEKGQGAVIGDVEVRVAGTHQNIPYKLMPDPDDPQQLVIAARDPATLALAPALRRGAKRPVSKDRDGIDRLPEPIYCLDSVVL